MKVLDFVKSGRSERTELRVSAQSPPSRISKMVLSTVYVGGVVRILAEPHAELRQVRAERPR